MNRMDLWLAKMARIVMWASWREKMAAWGGTCHSLLNAISAVFARESKAKQVGRVGGKTRLGGLLPIIKETIEILFQEGLLKVEADSCGYV